MADEPDNDDQWLYGDNPEGRLPETQPEPEKEPEESPKEAESEKPASTEPPDDEGPPGVDNEASNEQESEQNDKDDEGEEDGEVKQNGDDSEKEYLGDDSDDDVNVVIGDIKTTTSYASVNIKRGNLLSAPVDKAKQSQQQSGKFNVDEFEQIGTINGVPATEYNLDSLEEKPWRKPGADITDYFNYGFNEETWKAYCERQKRMRVNESGTGIAPMNSIGLPRGPIPIMNDNSKYSGNFIGGPPPRTVPPTIGGKTEGQKINTIQVMTADRREYSRKPAGFPDMSVPPPTSFDDFQPEYGFNPEPEPFYGGYEPTQDSQWGPGGDPGWTPTEIKTLTGGPPMGGPPPHIMGPPMNMPSHSPGRRSPPRERERDRESRSRSEKPRDRDRERSHRPERSRSKSRRHRSRSRSPGHRSHRKKKSRRHDDTE